MLEEFVTSRAPLYDELADDDFQVAPPSVAKWYVWHAPRRWYVSRTAAALLLAAIVATVVNLDACARQGPDYGWLCWELPGSAAVEGTSTTSTRSTRTTSTRSTSTTSTPKTTTTATLAWGYELPRTAAAHTAAVGIDPVVVDGGAQGTLFCFCLVWAGREEHALLSEQLRQGVGVFSCDDFEVYNGGSKSLTLGLTSHGSVVATSAVPDLPMPHAKGHYAEGGQTINSWLNVATWVRLWKEVAADRRATARAWTVKMDPDAVVLAWRLRTHLAVFDASRLLYVRNADCFGKEFHFLGALEVLSLPALEAYTAGIQLCYHEFLWAGWGEDYFTEHCLEFLGIDSVEDLFLVSDKSCHHADHGCTDQRWAAYHPLKSTWDQRVCIAQGLAAG